MAQRKRVQTSVNSRVSTILKSVLTQDRINWLEQNRERISKEFNIMRPELTSNKVESILAKRKIPFYTEKDFKAKIIDYALDSKLYGYNESKFISQKGYEYYDLYLKAIVTDIDKEYRLMQYKQSYYEASSRLGNERINYLVNKILNVDNDKFVDILNTTKGNTPNSLLPNMGLYYPKNGGIVDDEITTDIISDLESILDRFEIDYEKEEPDYEDKGTLYIPEDIYNPNKEANKKEFKYYYKHLNKELKKKYTPSLEHENLIDGVDVSAIEQDFLKSREHTLKYSKTGNPYMPFVKSSLVRRYYAKKG